MTPLGKKLFLIYSILAVIILMALDVRKIEKGEGKGWCVAALVPVFIFLLQLI